MFQFIANSFQENKRFSVRLFGAFAMIVLLCYMVIYGIHSKPYVIKGTKEIHTGWAPAFVFEIIATLVGTIFGIGKLRQMVADFTTKPPTVLTKETTTKEEKLAGYNDGSGSVTGTNII